MTDIKGVILVAGKGTRLEPFTDGISKCMLPVAGKPIMQYTLETMERLGIKEVCIVLRKEYREHIQGTFGDRFGNSVITYIEQDITRKGTATAVLSAKEFIGNSTALIMAGDILTEYEDVKKLYEFHKKHGLDTSMLLKRVDDPRRYGVAVLEGKRVVDIIEKPETPKSNLANASVYIGGPHLIKELENVPLSKRGEYEITDALYNICEEGRLYGIEMEGYWNDIGTPWNLLDANEYYMNSIDENIQGNVENSTIKGKVIIEEGAQVVNSYIEGPCYIAKGARIGPSAHILKHSYIGPNCEISGFSIVKNSIILDGTKAKHHAYIGDSLIGKNCNFGSSAQVANLRFDRKTVRMRLNGNEYDSGRRKLGCVCGHNVNFGVNCTILPGKKIGSNSIIGPGVIVSEDVPLNTRVLVKQSVEHTQITKV